MIIKLRKERKTIWHIFIVLMMMLLIVFLAAPASAAVVKYTYTPYVKVTDPPIQTQYRERLILTYRIPVVPVVMLRVYIKERRTITKWHNQRTRTTWNWCPKNRIWEKGPTIIQRGSSGTTTSSWKAYDYRITQT